MDTPEERAAQRARVAANFQAALGNQWQAKVTRALDLKRQNVNRMFSPPKGRADHPSTALEAVSEFLVGTPQKQWPARWRD
ncbi:hypothetical protein [uncultured Ruegeria sp.]|uniref:hypothetical protein n=1 Tax=uncultured Ruegeria sp. TaxID=259304 RepID=UPI00260BB824|nr:hypothetical protein [uncultured Ruegeria sp.]